MSCYETVTSRAGTRGFPSRPYKIQTLAFDFPRYAMAEVKGHERATRFQNQAQPRKETTMPLAPSEILEELRQIKYDLSVTQTRIGKAIEHIAALGLIDPDAPKCKICGVLTRSPRSLAEHVYNSHDGPLPEHYIEAERRAGIAHDEPEKPEPGKYWLIPGAAR